MVAFFCPPPFMKKGESGLPLDGLSPTGAVSMSRKLLSAYGGPLYTNVAGGVSALHDQSGSARDFTQSTAGYRPSVNTAGPKSRPSALFDGLDDFLLSSNTLADFIANNNGYVVVSFIANSIGTRASTSYSNDGVWCTELSSFAGVYLRNTPLVYGYNWDGNADQASTAISTGTSLVVEWLHTGGQLSIRVNAGSWVSVASGDTTSLSNKVNLGVNAASEYSDIHLFEWAAFNVPPSSGQRDAIASDFLNWIN